MFEGFDIDRQEIRARFAFTKRLASEREEVNPCKRNDTNHKPRESYREISFHDRASERVEVERTQKRDTIRRCTSCVA